MKLGAIMRPKHLTKIGVKFIIIICKLYYFIKMGNLHINIKYHNMQTIMCYMKWQVKKDESRI